MKVYAVTIHVHEPEPDDIYEFDLLTVRDSYEEAYADVVPYITAPYKEHAHYTNKAIKFLHIIAVDTVTGKQINAHHYANPNWR